MQQRQHTQSKQRLFTASEVAEFEYCPLVWWHEQFEPLAQAGNEELFARLVELEHEHGAQAPALPEYKVVEQLLLRSGAFEEGRQKRGVKATGRTRVIAVLAAIMICLALALIVAAVLLR